MRRHKEERRGECLPKGDEKGAGEDEPSVSTLGVECVVGGGVVDRRRGGGGGGGGGGGDSMWEWTWA